MQVSFFIILSLLLLHFAYSEVININQLTSAVNGASRNSNQNAIDNSNSNSGQSQATYRIMVSSKNAQFINSWNNDSNFDSDSKQFKLGPGIFLGLTNQQYQQTMLTLKPGQFSQKIDSEDKNGNNNDQNNGQNNGQSRNSKGAIIVINVDWRKNGIISSVKYQGQCGSCWAFSAISDMQSRYLSAGSSLDLSEQQLVDCSTANSGCNGGWMSSAWQYIITNKMSTQSAYPYLAIQQPCNTNVVKSYTLTSYVSTSKSCTKTLTYVRGRPISIAISAESIYFQHYSSGALSKCGTSINHAVNLVGVVQNLTQNYWIVKNSWGTGWGEQGYVRIARNTTKGANLCQVCSYPQYSIK